MLVFKEKSDLDLWRKGAGSRRTRDQIMLTACIIEDVGEGEDCVITSWYRPPDEGGHFHWTLEPFDVRIREFTNTTRLLIQHELHRQNIPAYPIDIGKPSQHWHVGDLATLRYERE